MTYQIKIDMDNDAFCRYVPESLTVQEGLSIEVSRILKELAEEISQQSRVDSYRNLIDANGNPCGSAKVVNYR